MEELLKERKNVIKRQEVIEVVGELLTIAEDFFQKIRRR